MLVMILTNKASKRMVYENVFEVRAGKVGF